MDALASAIAPMAAAVETQMEVIQGALGFTKSMTYFTVAFFASVPAMWVQGQMPGATMKHLFAALSGLGLYWFSFGKDIIHLVIPMAIVYLAMAIHRNTCGLVAWLVVFPYLIWCHVAQASGENWSNGEIDYTGMEMVVMLKLISVAMCYQDSKCKASELNEHQKEVKLDKLPSILEFVGYYFYCGTLFVGPYFEMKDYLAFSNGKGDWAKGKIQGGRYLTALRIIVVAIACMGFNLWASQWWSPSVLKEEFPWLLAQPLWKRLGALVLVSNVARFKYYFAFKLVECGLVLSGLSWNGVDKKSGKPRWDRLMNVDILGVEFCHTAAALPANWNICTGRWLRHYVYERVTFKDRKPGLLQIVSGVWHGLFPGYILFFISTAFFVHGSKVVYRFEKNLTGVAKHTARVLHTCFTMGTLGYLAVNFLLLDYASCIQAWSSVYYIPHFILLFTSIFLGFVPNKSGKPKKA